MLAIWCGCLAFTHSYELKPFLTFHDFILIKFTCFQWWVNFIQNTCSIFFIPMLNTIFRFVFFFLDCMRILPLININAIFIISLLTKEIIEVICNVSIFKFSQLESFCILLSKIIEEC